ncbi:hypothetical protein ACVBEQ_17045 [Nakamurella sp. GG22]
MPGDFGPPVLEHTNQRSTRQLADMVGAETVFLRIPGVVASPQIWQTPLDHHSHARATLAALDHLDLALVGIGAGGIMPALTPGDNFFTAAQVAQAKARGPSARSTCGSSTPTANWWRRTTSTS